MADITLAELDQAHARLADAKARKAEGSIDPAEYKTVKHEVAALRVAYKQQEEAAGRRTGIIGGDAVAD
jgi:hypothetical protein